MEFLLTAVDSISHCVLQILSSLSTLSDLACKQGYYMYIGNDPLKVINMHVTFDLKTCRAIQVRGDYE